MDPGTGTSQNQLQKVDFEPIWSWEGLKQCTLKMEDLSLGPIKIEGFTIWSWEGLNPNKLRATPAYLRSVQRTPMSEVAGFFAQKFRNALGKRKIEESSLEERQQMLKRI